MLWPTRRAENGLRVSGRALAGHDAHGNWNDYQNVRLAHPDNDLTKTIQLHAEFRAGDLLVADRAFCSFPHLCLLIERGVEVVLRIYQKVIVDFTPDRPHAVPNKGTGSTRTGLSRSRWLRRLGVQDQIVAWLKNPKSKPRWMTVERFVALTDETIVRELRYDVHHNGYRVKKITLVTTLLDDEIYSLPEIAELLFADAGERISDMRKPR